MAECLFCKMLTGKIVPDIVHENDHVLAFHDINPQAPVHVLIIPRKHIASLNDMHDSDAALIGELYIAAKEIAILTGIADSGYRTVMNCNADAGQSVFHIHLHVLGGRRLQWPPG